MIYIIIIIALFITTFILHNHSSRKQTVTWPITLLKEIFIPFYWIFYGPFMETFFGIFKCSDGYHKVVTEMSCYSAMHISFVVISILFVIFLMSLIVLYGFFGTENNPIQENAFARIDQADVFGLIAFRFVIIIYSTFVSNVHLFNFRKLEIGL